MKEKKDEYTMIRLSKEERKMLDQQAARLGLTISAYLRMLVYEKEKR